MTRFSRVLLATISTLFVLAPAMGGENAPVYEADTRYMADSFAEPVTDVLVSSVGYQLPEMTDETPWVIEPGDGAATFEEMRGEVLVIQSFNTNDARTRSAVHRVQRLLKDVGEGYRLVGVHVPTEEEGVETLIGRFTKDTPVFRDTSGEWCDELGIYTAPTLILVDRNGVIRHTGVALRAVRNLVKNMVADPASESSGAPALPPRSERVEDSPVLVKAPDFPSHNKELRGARDVQGKQAPSIQVQEWMNGEPKTDGKVVIVEFWATWCGPCIRNIPHMNELANTFRNDVVAIGISDEASQRVAPFVRGRDIDYAIAVDRSKKLFNFPRPRGIPHAYVQDSEGVVRWQGHPARLTERLLAQIVRADKGDTMAEPMRWTDAEG